MLRAILYGIIAGLAITVAVLKYVPTNDPCEGIYEEYAMLMTCQAHPSCVITFEEMKDVNRVLVPQTKACMAKQAEAATEAEAAKSAVFTQEDVEKFFRNNHAF